MQCAMQTVDGIDVSAGQGTINWADVKAAGRDFAFIKATQGNYNKQSTFTTMWESSLAAGVMRSAYHFFDPTISGTAQATWFLDELTAAGGMTAADLPPMLDIECPVSTSQATSTTDDPNCEYTGNTGWVATATMQQEIFDWLDAVEAATGRKAILYSYVSWFASLDFTDPRLATYPLYIASYNPCATIPAPWQQAVFWQYADNGTVSGVNGEVDLDHFFGSAGDLQTFNGSSNEYIDAGVGDGGLVTDAQGNADQNDAGIGPQAHAGCGCRTDAGAPSSALAFGVIVIIRRLRKRRPSY